MSQPRFLSLSTAQGRDLKCKDNEVLDQNKFVLKSQIHASRET